MKIAPFIIRNGKVAVYAFHCPGCNDSHWVQVVAGVLGGNAEWQFNGDMDNPTINPSILVNGRAGSHGIRCHSFVKNGRIEFLADCEHELAGKTVEMEEIGPDHYLYRVAEESS